MQERQDIHSIRSVPELLAQIQAGRQPRYLFFWGHQPEADGRVGKGCLSQWFEAGFTVEGAHYRSAEHFMMAEKARLFGDDEAQAKILQCASPAQAKALGRTVRGFDSERWNTACFDIVVRGNAAKFGQNAGLKAYLLTTGERVLVEASPVDAIWGIGLAAQDALAQQPEHWRGLNLLGFALMEARAQLRAGGQ